MKQREISWEKYPQENNETEEKELENTGLVLSSFSMTNTNPNQYEDFNFFIAHCNFYINENIVNILRKIEGVESLDILSPYRFRISVAKLFSVQEVLSEIKQKITNNEQK